MNGAPGPIAIYGASGQLGRLVTDELVSRAATVRLGGRDPHKVRAVAAGVPGNIDWKTAPADDAMALRELIRGCRVVVNAGPSSRTGQPLVSAALHEGVHYVDAAGEQSFIRRLFDQGGEAERRGVALVPACGFDYALGDCLARVIARAHERVREVTVAYAIAGAEVAGNSLQFAAETPGGGEVLFESGAWRPVRQEIFRRTVEFPRPFGRQAVARYASGEIITIPRHTQTDAVASLITVSSLVPDPRLIPLFPYLRPAVALVRRTPARSLLALAGRRRRAPSASPAAPEPPHFAIVVTVRKLDGSESLGCVEGGDFHRVTAATLAFVAAALASPAFHGRGALPPSVAVSPEALLDDLKRFGVTWRLEHSDTRPLMR